MNRLFAMIIRTLIRFRRALADALLFVALLAFGGCATNSSSAQKPAAWISLPVPHSQNVRVLPIALPERKSSRAFTVGVGESLVKIMGEVKNAGIIPIDQGMTLMETIVRAGGFVETANVERIRLARAGRWMEMVLRISPRGEVRPVQSKTANAKTEIEWAWYAPRLWSAETRRFELDRSLRTDFVVLPDDLILVSRAP